MHDNLTTIRDFFVWVYNPRAECWEKACFATLWHEDPETDGTDDSCGFSSPKLTAEERGWADRLINHPHDNIRSFFGDYRTGEHRGKVYIEEVTTDDMVRVCAIAMRQYKRHTTPWYRRARWHVHHWKLTFYFNNFFKDIRSIRRRS